MPKDNVTTIEGEIRPHDVELVARLCVLDKRMREIKQEEEQLKKEIRSAKEAVLANFTETGNQCVQYGNRTVFMQCQYFPKVKDLKKLIEVMRANGMQDLISEQPAKSAMYQVLREWLETATAELSDEEVAAYNLLDAIPEPFRDVLGISEKWIVKTRPAGKKVKRYGRLPGLTEVESDDEPF